MPVERESWTERVGLAAVLAGCAFSVGCGKVLPRSNAGAPPDTATSIDAASSDAPSSDAASSDAPSSDAPSSDASSTTTITFTNYTGAELVTNTTLVAFQDGDGAWQPVVGRAGVYTFVVTGERYGLLAVCSSSAIPLTAVAVSYFAVSDGAVRTGFDPCAPYTNPTRVTISGTIAGVQPGEQFSVDDGDDSIGSNEPGPWMLAAVPGPGALLAVRRGGDQRALALLLDSVTFGASAGLALDFTSTDAFSPAEAGLTLDPAGSAITMTTGYLRSDGTSFLVDTASTAPGAAPVTTYRVIPRAHLAAGRSTLSELSIDNDLTRSVLRVFETSVDQALTLPAEFRPRLAPQLVTTTPYPILVATLPQRSGARYYQLSYYSPAVPIRVWNLTYSAAWFAGTQGDLTSRLPDLSAIAGWDASYALPASLSGVQWSAQVGTGPARSLPGTSPFSGHGNPKLPYQDGDEITTSSSSGTLP